MASKVGQAEQTLKELGYEFHNDDEWLCRTKDNAEYVIPVTPEMGEEKTKGQKEHEQLLKWASRLVIERLEADDRLEKITLPTDADNTEPKSYFFHTKDCLKKDRIVVLIQTIGSFGAGVWDRDSFMVGLRKYSQLRYLDKVVAPTDGEDLEGLSFIGEFGLVLMNTNLICVDEIRIRQNESHQEHLACVWDSFLKHSKAAVDIIVCGIGYEFTFDWIAETPKLLRRLNKIALINPPNVVDIFEKISSIMKKKLRERTLTWASSEKQHGEIMANVTNTHCLSAGKRRDFGSLMPLLCDSIWTYLRRPETAERFALIRDSTVSLKTDVSEETETEKERLLPRSQSKASSSSSRDCCALI
eukprot:m.154361 g.154361  ORF g.154361 m.154361 type:complete len:358 (+) comp38638_c0_seq2:49-1122(+)